MRIRVASTVFVALASIASIYSEVTRDSYSGLDYGMFLFGLLWPLYAYWITEPERLPPSLATQLPRSRSRRLLLDPFLPGGGRTALLFTLQLLTLFAASIIGRGFDAIAGNDLWGWEGWVKSGMVACYLATWLLMTTALFSRWRDRPLVRAAVIVSIPVLAVSLPGLLAGLGSWVPSYAGNILAHFGHVRADGFIPVEYRPAYFTMLAVALVSIALNLPRMARGVHEVLIAPTRDSRT